MRKQILLCLFISIHFATDVSAQPYQSVFGTNSTEWTSLVKTSTETFHSTIYVSKDTVVNGLNYKKIAEYNSTWAGGLLREDISSGIVWYRDVDISNFSPEDTFEMIVLDMRLDVGDSFRIYKALHYNLPDTFAKVDSVKYINGLKHIYLHAQYNAFSEPYTMIEGVGSNLGINWKKVLQWSLDGYPYLLCSYKDEQKTGYQNKYYNGNCALNSINPIDLTRNISVYPQPASNFINIGNDRATQITKVEIVSPLGTVVKRYISGSSITHMDIKGIPSGYYIIRLFLDAGYIATKPVIIK